MAASPGAVVMRMIDKYGVEKTSAFVECMRRGGTFTEGGEVLGVTRQRAQQIAMTLGNKITVFQPHPEIGRLARERSKEQP